MVRQRAGRKWNFKVQRLRVRNERKRLDLQNSCLFTLEGKSTAFNIWQTMKGQSVGPHTVHPFSFELKCELPKAYKTDTVYTIVSSIGVVSISMA